MCFRPEPWSATVVMLLLVCSVAGAKSASRFVTAQMRQNALANVSKYEWAAAQQKAATNAAARWLEMSDDELWAMVTSQELPRDMHTNKEAGCPNCSDGITPYGNYPWRVVGDWKLECPNCGQRYPKNNFRAFYESALDEHGFFRRELGDQSLLFNAEHPDPNDPLHMVYVDDGYGMTDEKSVRHRFIAAYNYFGQWVRIRTALDDLARAYALTSEPVYAHKAAILLDRIADVYPDMDFAPFHALGFEHSHGGRGGGRVLGCLIENDHVWSMSRAYDIIFDEMPGNDALVQFCSAKSAQYQLGDKSSPEAICRHIEDNLLLEMLRSYKDGRIDGNPARIRNPAAAAIALDRDGETAEWLDYLFDPGYPYEAYQNPVPYLAMEGLDRDGMGGMCGGYGTMQKDSLIDLAEVMAAYPEYTTHNLVQDYPKLRQAFLIDHRLRCLNHVMPATGDSGSTGNWGGPPGPRVFLRGYKLYQDPRMAALAWHYSERDAEKLRLPFDDIFRQDPEALAREIAAVSGDEELALVSDHLGRYGQAVLQTERARDGRALWIHYGQNKGHSHHDCLNLGLYAKNIDMLPDLGYPEYTGGWPKRGAWTSNTISHNTLLVNDRRSGYSPGGKLQLFAIAPPLRALDVSSLTAYEGMRTYRRTVAMVDVSPTDSYIVDIFRARGGSSHRLSYHGPSRTATVQGITLRPQPTGTFAGPDVEFTALPNEGENSTNTSGFSYLYDVERSGGPVSSYYTVDWQGEDLRGRITEGHEPHLRLHSLSAYDEVALASGDPPQNKSGNPRSLRYLIQSRLGDDLESQFVNVLEPYDTTPFITQVRQLQVTHEADTNFVVAVAVEMADGTVDILIDCEQPTSVHVEGGIEFDGQLGLIRLVEGQVSLMRMCNASLLQYRDITLTAPIRAYEGMVVAIDASDPLDNTIILDPPLPQDDSLLGTVIHFDNSLALDTSYDIKTFTADGISTGDITIVHGFVDKADFSAGYRYLDTPEDRYLVPLIRALDRQTGLARKTNRGTGAHRRSLSPAHGLKSTPNRTIRRSDYVCRLYFLQNRT
jgi:hypothetical protein